jgi:hypothetical protein
LLVTISMPFFVGLSINFVIACVESLSWME